MGRRKVPSDIESLTGREWRLYRRGAIEGAEKLAAVVKKASGSRAAAKAVDDFLLKLACGGIELDVPAAPSAVHPMTKWRAQLKREEDAA